MLSPADMLVVGVAALLFFGPDQLPKVARRAGQVVRDVQATSASFIREMERAADEPDHHAPYVAPEPYAPEASTVTIDREPASINHAPPFLPDAPASLAEPHAALDDVHVPLDQPLPPIDQTHIAIPHTENGSTEPHPPESAPASPTPPPPI